MQPLADRRPRDALALAADLRRRLGPAPESGDWPPVSAIVLNRDGADHLRRLVASLAAHTDYPALELIVVDNGSSDDSLDFLRSVEAPFPISIVANPHNESFSNGCNQGAELAAGDLLLFLNNDVEAFESGWLRELVACLQVRRAGAVSATLLCPDDEHESCFRHGYGVAHRGLAFRDEGGVLHPVLRGWEDDPLDEDLGRDAARGAVSAACLLVERQAFERVDGFSRGFHYGAEDVDLCLKLRSASYEVVCSGRSLCVHHPVSTRRRAPFEEERARKLGNHALLWERWGPRLRREHELERSGSDGEWALGFCIKAADPGPALELGGLRAPLEARGYRCLVLEGDRAEDPLGLSYDVAVHVRGRWRYLPKSGQLNVIWDVGGAERLASLERDRYDLVIGPEPGGLSAERLLAAVEARASELGLRCRIDVDAEVGR